MCFDRAQVRPHPDIDTLIIEPMLLDFANEIP